MLILAVDTSTRRGSVALRQDGAPVGEVRLDLEGGHSAWLLGAVEGLLRAAGRGARELGGLAVVTGPGSFTGLRVGLATIQGLALPRGTPCFGVSTLDLLAWKVRGTAQRIAAVMDAWRSELFVGEYDGRGVPDGAPSIETPAALLARIAGGGWSVFGDGAVRYREQILDACPGAVLPERSLFLASTLAELAEGRLESGEGIPAAQLRPHYLRPPALSAPKR